MKNLSESTDFVLFDRANNSIVKFEEDSSIIFYGNEEEAIEDCFGNEEVVKVSELYKTNKELFD